MIHLAEMKNLKSLWLGGTHMFGTPERDQQLAALRKALPNLGLINCAVHWPSFDWHLY